MTTIQIKVPNWLDKICVWPLMTYRKRRYGWPFRKIDLGQGKFTIVEPPDYYRLQCFKWWLHSNGSNLYAARTAITDDLQAKIIYLQRQIMQPPDHLVVDHKNCDSLDNRRENLRVVTQAENMRNRRKRKNTSSRFIGVWFDKKRNKYTVQIRYKGRKLWLGRFKSETDAARAYDRAARQYCKEFARLNFP
ncbi:MAG: HNH endonuclease signature motif containing protein [Planctomycetota bacterium]